jgi:hypothetical protein
MHTPNTTHRTLNSVPAAQSLRLWLMVARKPAKHLAMRGVVQQHITTTSWLSDNSMQVQLLRVCVVRVLCCVGCVGEGVVRVLCGWCCVCVVCGDRDLLVRYSDGDCGGCNLYCGESTFATMPRSLHFHFPLTPAPRPSLPLLLPLSGAIDASMKTSIKLCEYDDILEQRDIYSLLCLAALRNKFYGICSKAFVKVRYNLLNFAVLCCVVLCCATSEYFL